MTEVEAATVSQTDKGFRLLQAQRARRAAEVRYAPNPGALPDTDFFSSHSILLQDSSRWSLFHTEGGESGGDGSTSAAYTVG
jgi:hypothetical protein